MKTFPLLIFVFFSTVAISQSTNLAQGAYYSEPVGAEKLSKVQRRLLTKKDWTRQADSIKRQILKGMEMETFPAKTPLNPKFRNKKILNGYSVEAVVFESMPGFFVRSEERRCRERVW